METLLIICVLLLLLLFIFLGLNSIFRVLWDIKTLLEKISKNLKN